MNWRGRFTSATEALISGAVALVAVILIVVPIVRLLIGSLSHEVAGQVVNNYSFANYLTLVHSPEMLTALRNTMISSAVCTVGAALLGVSLAWLTARTDMPWRGLFETLNLIPFFLSPFVGALAWQLLAAPRSGVLNRLLMSAFHLQAPPFNIYSLGGITWVLILFYTPYMYLFTIGSLRKMDPSLEEAARMSGSGIWSTARRVTLPLVAPAILSGMLITFVTSAGVFDVPVALGSVVGIETLATQIYKVLQYPPNFPLASAIGCIMLLLTMVIVYFQRRILQSRSFAVVTGKGYRPRVIQLGRWRYFAWALNLLYLLFAAILPTVILLLVAIQKVWVGQINPQQWTLQNFVYVLFQYPVTKRALMNSMLLGLVGATVAVFFVLVLSYLIHRSRVPGRGLLDFVVALPITVPGIVLAMGILLTWIKTPLYGTLTIIGLAYVTRFMPNAQRTVASVLVSIHPELDESSRVSGASWLTTLRRILIPLLRPGLSAAWIMLFVIFVRELGASVLLYAPGTEVMSVAMLYISSKNMAFTAAFAVIQTVLLLMATAVFRWVVGTGDISL